VAEGAAEGEGGDGDAPGATTVAVAPVYPADPDLADPDAVRLALLARPRHARVELDPAALDEARDTLARLRRAVADWARHPSRPVPGDVRDRLRAAWEDDLDAPGVLRVLRRVETDPDLPDGARFEICAYADRFLGLQLTRDVGSPQ
jgi:cysteinyl-tRNA synthetase